MARRAGVREVNAPDAREIAAGLTKAQAWVLRLWPKTERGGCVIWRHGFALGTVRALEVRGLTSIFAETYSFRLTPLGQQVAAILKGERDG